MDFTEDELKEIYKKRVKILSTHLAENNIGACVFIDSEEHREPAVRYYTGHISDAVVIIFSDGYSILIPWDENLAKQYATASKIIPYTKYKNSDLDAVKAVLKLFDSHMISGKVELPPYLTYPHYLQFLDALSNFDCRCTNNGSHDFSTRCRIVKDEYEINCLKTAAKVGDLIIDEIEKQIRAKKIKTEMDVALLIEKMCRENKCERTGFDTLAAGPERSFAIHAFPGYTDSPWPAKGLSILDFGLVYKGYTSDTTLTVACGKLSLQQQKQLNLVEHAYQECLKLYTPEHTIVEAAKKADAVFAKAGRKMPHTLGHGIGLEIHEYPRVSTKTDSELHFLPGMVLTCEPGLYDPEIGGTRLENDVLITNDGNEVISHSRIIILED